MSVLQADDIQSLVAFTQSKVDKHKYTDLMTDTTEHIALPQLMNEERVEESTGRDISWMLVTGTDQTAKAVGLWQQDDYSRGDDAARATMPWRHIHAYAAYDDHEIALNGGAEQILNMVQVQEDKVAVDWAEYFESFFWGKPETSADTLTPYGLKMYVKKDILTTSAGDSWPTNAGGFNGGNPAGFTSGVGGVDSSTVTRWANWACKYTQVSKKDLLRKLKYAELKTNFIPPTDIPQNLRSNRGRAYYTGIQNTIELNEILATQNDNLGDLQGFEGNTLFMRKPVKYVPKLDADPDAPFYGINWASLSVEVLRGWWMRRLGPNRLVGTQHNVLVTDHDTSLNLKCTNRRLNFVMSKADSDA